MDKTVCYCFYSGESAVKIDQFPRGSAQTLQGVVRPHHNVDCSPKKDFSLEWKIWKCK